MKIRARLTLLFISIVAVILVAASVLIYLFSADYREDDFYNRLQSKAVNTAKLLIEVDEVDANLLKKIEKDNPVSLPNEKIIIYNYKDTILYSSDDDHSIKIDPKLLNKIRLDGNIRFTQGNFEMLGLLYAHNYDRCVVIAGATDIYGLNKLKNLRTILIIVCGASIVVVSLAGWFYAGRALKPISSVIHEVDEISIASLSNRLDEGNGTDEIALLAKTFNNMLVRLEQAFHLQKNFIANASHELRTPLAAITGQLEVSLMAERTADNYKKVLHSTLDDIRRLNQIANRLLMHAQADVETPDRNFALTRVDDLLWQVRDELSKRNPQYQIFVHLDEQLDDEHLLAIRGDEQLLKAAIMNLIENSCKYSSNHRSDIFVQPVDGTLLLKFEDNGFGIDDEDLKSIFEPFHRGKNVAGISGHGIGLSLVDRIVRLHSGSVRVESHVGVGTTFFVTLPIA